MSKIKKFKVTGVGYKVFSTNYIFDSDDINNVQKVMNGMFYNRDKNYLVGKTYRTCSKKRILINYIKSYQSGFHIYHSLDDAKSRKDGHDVIVKVSYPKSKVVATGTEGSNFPLKVVVSAQIKIEEIVV